MCTFGAQGDPGYQATVVMLGEAGECLAFDPLAGQGEVLTLAAAMGAPAPRWALRRRGALRG